METEIIFSLKNEKRVAFKNDVITCKVFISIFTIGSNEVKYPNVKNYVLHQTQLRAIN